MASKQVVLQLTYEISATSKFDMKYYLEHHMPLVEKLWGPQGVLATNVSTDEGNGAERQVRTAITFRDMACWKGIQHIEEIMGDIPKFTDVTPGRWVGTIVAQKKLGSA